MITNETDSVLIMIIVIIMSMYIIWSRFNSICHHWLSY